MKKTTLFLTIGVILISLFGIIMIYSASNIWSEYKYGDSLKYVKNQLLFFIIGLFLMISISKLNYKWYYKNANKIFFTCLILLILVLIPGIGSVRNGSRSWFGIGPFGIQPSEATKIGLIIFVSKYLSNNEHLINNIKRGVLPVLILTLLVFFIIVLQPDFGTGTIIVMSIVGLLFVSGASIKFFIRIGLLGVGLIVGLIIAAPYRLARILSFLDPWKDPLGSGFQIIQSLYAIGPAGLFGMGFGNSIQKHFYLPEPQTDFIFSIISEEFGIMGIIFVVTIFLCLIFTCFKICFNTDNLFAKYLSFGITFQFSFQTLLNLMVVVGLIPVTG